MTKIKIKKLNNSLDKKIKNLSEYRNISYVCKNMLKKGVFIMATIRSAGSSLTILKITLGIMFIVLGICGVSDSIDESVFRLSWDYTGIEVIFGVIEIICGLVLLFGHLFLIKSRAIYWGSLVILIFWLVRIALTKFAWGILIRGGNMTINSFFTWLLELFAELTVAAALYVLLVRND